MSSEKFVDKDCANQSCTAGFAFAVPLGFSPGEVKEAAKIAAQHFGFSIDLDDEGNTVFLCDRCTRESP